MSLIVTGPDATPGGAGHATAADLAGIHPALLDAYPQIRDNAAQARSVGHADLIAQDLPFSALLIPEDAEDTE